MTKASTGFTVVGLGELLWDLFPDGKRLGGAPANFAYHAQALGGRGVVISCVGNDELGKEILASLRETGLDLRHIAVDGEHPTGKVSVKLDDSGRPDFTIHVNVAWDFMRLTPGLLDLAARTDAVCFGSLAQRSPVSRDTIQRFIEATRPDCLRVFDINLRQSFYSGTIIRKSLDLCDVLKLNDDELPVLAELLSIAGEESEILDRLAGEFSLRAIALTRGERGSLLFTPEEKAEHPGFPPGRIADTVGAGDAFTAAMTIGMLQGKSLDDIAEHANRLASYVCSQEGAMPAIPDVLY
jgi:fructokinase